MLTKIAGWSDFVMHVLFVLAGSLVVSVMLIICFGVVMRFFLRAMQDWTFEVVEYALLYITFLGAAWVLKEEGHVKMDLVLNKLGPNARAILNIITSSIGIIIFSLLTWFGMKVTWEYFLGGVSRLTILRPPLFTILAIIPIGCFFLLIQCFKRTAGFFENRKGHK